MNYIKKLFLEIYINDLKLIRFFTRPIFYYRERYNYFNLF